MLQYLKSKYEPTALHKRFENVSFFMVVQWALLAVDSPLGYHNVGGKRLVVHRLFFFFFGGGCLATLDDW